MFRRTRAGLLSITMLPIGIGLAIQEPVAQAQTSFATEAQAGPVSYSRQVAPIFQAKCSECHGAETKEAGLDLSNYAGVMKGSEYGTVVEAGDAAGSLLIEMVTAGEMPQDADPLPAEEINLIRQWIQAGATNN